MVKSSVELELDFNFINALLRLGITALSAIKEKRVIPPYHKRYPKCLNSPEKPDCLSQKSKVLLQNYALISH